MRSRLGKYRCVCFLVAWTGLEGLTGSPALGQAVNSPGAAYIDNAVPGNVVRFRYDAAYDDFRPDRAEFFYSQYRQQQFTPAALGLMGSSTGSSGPGGGGSGGGGGGGGGPGRPVFVNGGRGADVTSRNGQFFIYNSQAQGLGAVETRIDYQDVTAYVEKLVAQGLSGFVELPVRFLNPEVNPNTAGLADMNAGFKWAFLNDPDRVASFQLRAYIPTGASSHGLGTNHVSLEPALLYYEKLSDRLVCQAELRDFIPIGGTDFQGNVIRYGVGFTYSLFCGSTVRVAPVVEMVGWTVLDGKQTAALAPNVFEVQDASGVSIFNAKVGVRMWVGDKSDFYVGYGRALTGDVWYKDILRVEYRLNF